MTSFLLCALIAQDAADRLREAIRETRPDDARAALRDAAAGDASRAARTPVLALPRCRDRIDALHEAVGGAHQDITRIETGLTLTKDEERLKKEQLEAARERLKRVNRAAIDGELVYDAVREAFALLKPASADAIGAELASTNSWLLKCEILEGLGRMKAVGPALALLDREQEPAVLAAALGIVETPRAIDFLAHPAWQVRLAAARSVRGAREAAGPLVERLNGADARLRAAVVQSLAALTKTSLPADAWPEWWRTNRDDWESGRCVPGAPRAAAGPGRTTFFEIPIESTRVAFLIDRSRSMLGQGRLDRAKAELKRLLRELPNGARFNVLFFGETVSSFATSYGTRLLDAASRRDAERWIDGMGVEDQTNLLLGLAKALALVGNPDSGRLRDDGPDTIVVLSDGAPTAGRLTHEELVARVAARRARWLRPVIHAVALSPDAKSLPVLARLAGGECRQK